MKKFWGVVVPFLMLFLSIPVMAASNGLSIKSKRVKIIVSKDVMDASEKVEVLKKYEVLKRLKNEIEGQLGSFPDSTRVEIEMTAFRLRSAKGGFFGMSGKDVIDGTITAKNKNKQIARFTISSGNGRSGKAQSPTRRLMRVITRFGEKFSKRLNRKMRRMQRMPANINIHIPRRRY
jgi:hypothetical protein